MSEARVPCSPGEEVREVAASGDTGLMLQLLDGGAPFILDMVRHELNADNGQKGRYVKKELTPSPLLVSLM